MLNHLIFNQKLIIITMEEKNKKALVEIDGNEPNKYIENMLDENKKVNFGKKIAKEDLLKEIENETATAPTVSNEADKENKQHEPSTSADTSNAVENEGEELNFGKKIKKPKVKFDEDQNEVIEVRRYYYSYYELY
jgi:hypothetical protein